MPRAFSLISASTVHSTLAAGTRSTRDSERSLRTSRSLPSTISRLISVQCRSYGTER